MSSLDSAASTVQRLAVLLSAGVAPTTAWRYLDTTDPVVATVTASIDRGATVAAAIESASRGLPARDRSAWRGVAAAWTVATDAGAPLAGALRDFARSLRTLATVERDVGTALAGPKATARMVMFLPAIGILFGVVLGFDTIGVLFTTVPGVVCLVVGGSLLALAALWNRRLVAAAQPHRVTPGLRHELVAISVTGGGSVDRAVASVDAALAQFDLAEEDGGSADRVTAVIALSVRAGVPAAELLRSEAEEARRQSAADAERTASVLAVKLMLPLGLCILPSFIVLGVVPLLIAVISSTVSNF
jgi:tight adherence protein B